MNRMSDSNAESKHGPQRRADSADSEFYGDAATRQYWSEQAARFSRHDFQQSWAFLQNSVNAYNHHLHPYVYDAQVNPSCSYSISYATIQVPVLHFKPERRSEPSHIPCPIRQPLINHGLPLVSPIRPRSRVPLAAIDANVLRQPASPTRKSKEVSHVVTNQKSPSKLSPRHESHPGLRQPQETIDVFLHRLPPFGYNGIEDWIRIANPQHGTNKSFDDSKLTNDIQQLIEAGQAMLDSFEPTKGKGKTHEIDDLKHCILDLASELTVTSGKWMLFVTEKDGESIWRKVCESVLNNKLGTGAKIAAQGAPKSQRLICVYTKDFDDTDDVKRTLFHLRDLQVLPPNKGIFYKPDAFTHLKIYSQNSWGIAPSLYSSADIFRAEDAKSKKPPRPNHKRSADDGQSSKQKRTKVAN